jgi:hypothetical protein
VGQGSDFHSFLFALAALVDFHSLKKKILRYPYLGFGVFKKSLVD